MPKRVSRHQYLPNRELCDQQLYNWVHTERNLRYRWWEIIIITMEVSLALSASEMNESFPSKERPIVGPGPGFIGGFFLRLANGQGWNILFTEGTRSLVERGNILRNPNHFPGKPDSATRNWKIMSP